MPFVKRSNVKSFEGFHVRVSKTTGQNCAKGNIFVTCEKSEQKTIPTGLDLSILPHDKGFGKGSAIYLGMISRNSLHTI